MFRQTTATFCGRSKVRSGTVVGVDWQLATIDAAAAASATAPAPPPSTPKRRDRPTLGPLRLRRRAEREDDVLERVRAHSGDRVVEIDRLQIRIREERHVSEAVVVERERPGHRAMRRDA